MASGKTSAGFGGSIWFVGWLFTIGYANLLWWQAILAVAIWPWYLGILIR